MALSSDYLNESTVIAYGFFYTSAYLTEHPTNLLFNGSWHDVVSPRKVIKVRWDDVMIEAPDMNNKYCMCIGKVTTLETSLVAEPLINPDFAIDNHWYLIRNAQPYRIVQHRIYEDLSCNEQYRELLVQPLSLQFYFDYFNVVFSV